MIKGISIFQSASCRVLLSFCFAFFLLPQTLLAMDWQSRKVKVEEGLNTLFKKESAPIIEQVKKPVEKQEEEKNSYLKIKDSRRSQRALNTLSNAIPFPIFNSPRTEEEKIVMQDNSCAPNQTFDTLGGTARSPKPNKEDIKEPLSLVDQIIDMSQDDSERDESTASYESDCEKDSELN